MCLRSPLDHLSRRRSRSESLGHLQRIECAGADGLCAPMEELARCTRLVGRGRFVVKTVVRCLECELDKSIWAAVESLDFVLAKRFELEGFSRDIGHKLLVGFLSFTAHRSHVIRDRESELGGLRASVIAWQLGQSRFAGVLAITCTHHLSNHASPNGAI